MPNTRQSHTNAHLQEVLSACQYITVDQHRSIDTGSTFADTIASNKERANIVLSPIAPSTRSSLTKKVDEDTPKPMAALCSRLHARRSAGRPRLGATGEAILSEVSPVALLLRSQCKLTFIIEPSRSGPTCPANL